MSWQKIPLVTELILQIIINSVKPFYQELKLKKKNVIFQKLKTVYSTFFLTNHSSWEYMTMRCRCYSGISCNEFRDGFSDNRIFWCFHWEQSCSIVWWAIFEVHIYCLRIPSWCFHPINTNINDDITEYSSDEFPWNWSIW